MIEEVTREARRNALKAANDALQLDRPNAAVQRIEFDPFADDAVGISKVGGNKGRRGSGGGSTKLLSL